MFVTPAETVIDVSPEQPSNAWLPMLVTPSGTTIDVISSSSMKRRRVPLSFELIVFVAQGDGLESWIRVSDNFEQL